MKKTFTIEEKSIVEKTVGEASETDMQYVDIYLTSDFGIFIPSTGFCRYAVKPSHTHPGYMFIFNYDNQSKIRLGNKIYSGESGMFFALSPNMPHEEIIPEDKEFARYIAVMIAKDYFEKEYAYYGRPLKSIECEYHESGKELIAVIKDFMLEYESSLPQKDILLRSIALNITHKIIRSILDIPVKNFELTERFDIASSLEYMHNNFDKDISIGDIASFVHLSQPHFHRLFKNETGKTPANYLSELRLDKSRSLLKNTDLSITDIALKCGFGSSSHYSFSFKKRFKKTPLEYRMLFK